MTQEKTVLIADDSSAIRAISKKLLDGSEFKIVAEAANGQEAIEQYKLHRPDVAVLDIVMPEVDGKGALTGIMEVDPNACVLMSSSAGTEENVEECLTIGAKSFITKPFQADDFLTMLRRITG